MARIGGSCSERRQESEGRLIYVEPRSAAFGANLPRSHLAARSPIAPDEASLATVRRAYELAAAGLTDREVGAASIALAHRYQYCEDFPPQPVLLGAIEAVRP
jgi:hypothetical protein